jgi:hypothetical protein
VEIERFEAAAGDLLEDLGYDRAFPHPSRAVTEQVTRIKEIFIANATALGRVLPKNW